MSIALAIGVGLGTGAAAYLSLAWYVWFHRRGPGGRGLVALLLATFVWAACYALEVESYAVHWAQVWSGLKYVGIVALPPALVAFVAEYTGRKPLRHSTLLLLCIEPVVVLTVLAVPAWAPLIHSYPGPPVVPPQARPILAHPGTLFWPHAIYTYALLGAAIVTLVSRLVRIARPYRRQAWAVSAVTFLPLVGNLLYNLQVPPFTIVDPTPFLFLLTAVVFVWGFFRLALLDLRPVARDVIVEQMADGVLVLDVYGRVVDTNPAGTRMLGRRRADLVGRDLAEVLPAARSLLTQSAGEPPGRTGSADLRVEGSDREVLDLSVTVTGLVDHGSASGWLVVLRDITDRLADQRRMGALLREQTRLADTLTRGLRPQALPELPGIALAARWIPATGNGERQASLSGDFYDVHPAGDGEWALVLGDVAGKGVEAAMQTAMARYTLRTLSAQGWRPRQVLEQLNAALTHAALIPLQSRTGPEGQGRPEGQLRTDGQSGRPEGPREPQGLFAPPARPGPAMSALLGDDAALDRFCTLFYARLAAAPAPGAVTGVRLTVALGGHPQPLVRRADGSVEAVGEPGTALGLLEQVSVQDCVVDLAPGDVLLAYTDGVTEARKAREMFGEDRLAQVLASSASGLIGRTGAAAARLVADAVADRVVGAVTEYSGDRDDVTVLVLTVA